MELDKNCRACDTRNLLKASRLASQEGAASLERRSVHVAQHDAFKHMVEEPHSLPPIQRFRADRLAKRETIVKQEIDAYFVSDVDNTASIMLDRQAMPISCSLDLPDAVCDGLTFKQRLVQTEHGDCLLIARWKPERHMRRNAPEWSQKWFVEKQVYPSDTPRLFSRLEKRLQEEGVLNSEAATPMVTAVLSSGEGEGDDPLMRTSSEPEVEPEDE